jgi:hypothetical protein
VSARDRQLARARDLRTQGRTGVRHEPHPFELFVCVNCGCSMLPSDDCRGSRIAGVFVPYRRDARFTDGVWVLDSELGEATV